MEEAVLVVVAAVMMVTVTAVSGNRGKGDGGLWGGEGEEVRAVVVAVVWDGVSTVVSGVAGGEGDVIVVSCWW